MRNSRGSYVFPGALAVWALVWVLAACLAAVRVSESADAFALLALVVAAALGAFFACATLRTVPVGRGKFSAPPAAPESLGARLSGCFAGLVWCVVAIGWNIGVISWVIEAARTGSGGQLLVMIPFSLIGAFLLVILLIGIGTTAESTLGQVRRGQSRTDL